MLEDWQRNELNERRGRLGGYQAKRKIVEYKQGMPKLTPGMQNKLLADYSAGMPIKDIAFKYGVCESYPTQLAARRCLPLRDHWVTRRAKALAAQNRRKKC